MRKWLTKPYSRHNLPEDAERMHIVLTGKKNKDKILENTGHLQDKLSTMDKQMR